jgi:hypothetical protein
MENIVIVGAYCGINEVMFKKLVITESGGKSLKLVELYKENYLYFIHTKMKYK